MTEKLELRLRRVQLYVDGIGEPVFYIDGTPLRLSWLGANLLAQELSLAIRAFELGRDKPGHGEYSYAAHCNDGSVTCPECWDGDAK